MRIAHEWWAKSPIEPKPKALETTRICPIYAQKEILRNYDNGVISRDFYRFFEIGDEVAAAMLKG
ncbi:MAG TPA: hypothetical protein VNY08_12995 [Bradyrhizobium sp.]|nr:hypothetical protein [Bradyrhizobium sp.]